MQRFQDIHVWRRTHAIVLLVYGLTERFPPDEKFHLAAQLRRAAASVPTNIAEGSKRLFRRDYVRFLNVAEGSLTELEYLLLLARDLELADVQSCEDLLRDVEIASRMLANLRKAVQRAQRGAPTSRRDPRGDRQPSTRDAEPCSEPSEP